MAAGFTLYLAQLAPTLGAIQANCERITEAYAAGLMAGADLVLTPELSVIGYPPEDLVNKPAFVADARRAVTALAAITAGEGEPGLIVGAPWADGDTLYNAAILLADGEIQAVRAKHELPNYGVFDEMRHFTPGPLPEPVAFRGLSLGLMTCEDMWLPHCATALGRSGVDMLLVPTCSPFTMGKEAEREAHAHDRSREAGGVPLVFCNQVGGQDQLVFDGASFVTDGADHMPVRLDAWDSGGCVVAFDRTDDGWSVATRLSGYQPDGDEAMYYALVLGLRDYVTKIGFPGVVLGLSGGIDSALAAAIAVDALGADRVRAVMMPSRYTSAESLEDAAAVADLLGIRCDTVTIEPGVEAMNTMLGDVLAGAERGVTDENIQSRLRGVVLMALSNSFGHMVLSTGNKSELAVGYATLYGDMNGGFNAIKDVYKTEVMALCRWRNGHRPDGLLGPDGPVMPERVISKPPSAELRADQKDEDSLPPYDVLDAMLRGLVDEEASVADLADRGFDRDDLARVEKLLYMAEYKRHQAPPGTKVSRRNFGRDRRYPLVNAYRTGQRPA
ncbi:NAD+ synthase [Yunchengibacter salinarum]|uniref:NAD+ synthase n=1 Tax=Yunchengibacter salinarum TaxID=3133399 RepID=UPI0035B57F6D